MALLTDLVAYYKLDDDAANTDVDDATGNSDGTLVGGDNTATLSVAGTINEAFDFNGSDDSVNVGTMGTLGQNLADGLSISFWVTSTDTGIMAITGMNMSPSSQTWGFYINRAFGLGADASKLTVVMRDVDGNLFSAGTTNDVTIVDGNPHHVVMTIIGQVVTIYVDDDSKAISIGNNNLADNFIDFTIDNYFGAENAAGSIVSHVDGVLDELGIWNRVLSAAEVTELYNSGSGLAYPFSTDVTPTPSTLTLTLAGPAPTISIDHIAVGSGLGMTLSIVRPIRVLSQRTDTQGTKGTKTINKLDIPSGIGDTMNLVFQTSSSVLSKNRKGLELDGGRF